MTDETKVIEFPKEKVVREIPEEHLKARQAKADRKLAESIVDDLTGILITELDNCYIEVTDKTFAKDFVLVVDALRATIYRQYDLEHHLHQFLDDNVKLIDGAAGMTKDELADRVTSIIQEMIKEKVDLDEEE